MSQITIALTKGRIEEDTVKLLTQAGFDMSFMADKGRSLIFESPDSRFRFLLVKGPDVTTYVRHGVADLGIVGKDILFEHPTGYLELLDLNFGLCKFSLASVPSYDPHDHKRKRIATKYPTVATDYFNQKGEDVEIISIQAVWRFHRCWVWRMPLSILWRRGIPCQLTACWFLKTFVGCQPGSLLIRLP